MLKSSACKDYRIYIYRVVPHHIRSFIALNCKFRNLLEDLKTMNNFFKMYKTIKKIMLVNTRFFEYFVRILGLKLENNLI